jgi:hypothetical protein
MRMYHKDSEGSVDVHASQIENMKNAGWTEHKPKGKTEAPKGKTKED